MMMLSIHLTNGNKTSEVMLSTCEVGGPGDGDNGDFRGAAMLMRPWDYPSIDAPRAPLADVYEVDDFLIDNATGQSYDMQFGRVGHALNEESESSNTSAEGEEEMEGNIRDVDMVLENDDSFDDGGVELDEDDEYPELARLNGEAVVESESHDFAVMDTEKDMNSINRKRKADSSTTRRMKRSR